MTAIITQNRHSEEQQPDIKDAADKRGGVSLIWCEEDKHDYVSVRTGPWGHALHKFKGSECPAVRNGRGTNLRQSDQKPGRRGEARGRSSARIISF